MSDILYQTIIQLAEMEANLNSNSRFETQKTDETQTKQTTITTLTNYIDNAIRANIIADAVEEARYKNVIIVNSTDRDIALTDGSNLLILVTTGAADRTITIDTAAMIAGLNIKIIKVDSGAGHIIIQGEGGENIYNQLSTFTSLEIWLQNSFIELTSDGTNLFKTNSPYIHFLPDASRTSGSWDLSVNPTTVWAEADLSALCPPGTLALWGEIFIQSTDPNAVLWLRDSNASISNSNQAFSVALYTEAAYAVGYQGLIKAENGKFDYCEQAATTEIASFVFGVRGWLL